MLLRVKRRLEDEPVECLRLENQKRVCLGADIEDGTVFVLKRAGLKKQQSSVLPEQLPKMLEKAKLSPEGPAAVSIVAKIHSGRSGTCFLEAVHASLQQPRETVVEQANSENAFAVYDEYEVAQKVPGETVDVPKLVLSETYDPEIFLNEEESDADAGDYSEDSNAESYYQNDYPDDYDEDGISVSDYEYDEDGYAF